MASSEEQEEDGDEVAEEEQGVPRRAVNVDSRSFHRAQRKPLLVPSLC